MTTREPDVSLVGVYTKKQTAEALGISRKTVDRWQEKGVLRFRVRKADNRPVITGSQIMKCWKQMYV